MGQSTSLSNKAFRNNVRKCRDLRVMFFGTLALAFISLLDRCAEFSFGMSNLGKIISELGIH